MHTGVGDDDIEPAQFADGGVDRCGHRLGVAHVGRRGHASPTSIAHLRCGAVQIIGDLGGIESDHIRAFVGEPLAVHASGSPGGTGHDDHLAVKSRHHGAFSRLNPL